MANQQTAPARHLRGSHAAHSPWRTLALTCAILLAVALIPMLVISIFDHSYADDWHYGVDVHLALQAGGGVVEALRAALAKAASTYFSWQGTYSAIFLMALQPGVFSEALYGWGAVFIMFSLVAATFYASYVFVRDLLHGDGACASAIACVALLLQTQLLPSPVEGIWWYNSAIYYTFYHALMLVMVALAVRVVRGKTARRAYGAAGTAVRALVLVLLAFVVAGGNFVTGLVAVLVLLAVFVAGLIRWRRRAWIVFPALVVLVVGFAFSMAAPGNAERQMSQFAGDNIGVIATLVRSSFAGFEYLVLWTNGYLVVALAALVPVFVYLARRSPWSFRLPGVAALAALALFMASFTPTFFSMGTVGPGRVQNIRYDLFVVLVFACTAWTCGWCVRQIDARMGRDGADAGRGLLEAPGAEVGEEPAVPPLGAHASGAPGAHARSSSDEGLPERPGSPEDAPAHLPRFLRWGYIMLACVLVVSVVALAIDERHVDDLTSISATASLLSGEAEEYDHQIWDRIERIESTDADTVEVPFITTAPKVLFMGDIRDNMDTYINFRLSQWYGKEAILGYHGLLGG